MVVWDEAASTRSGTFSSVSAQQFTAAGKKRGNQSTVATGTSTAVGRTLWSSVAMNANGPFAVAYEVTGTPGRLVRVYNANGTPKGAAVLFAATGYLDEEPTAVAIDGAGT